jgi:hypothetical protein
MAHGTKMNKGEILKICNKNVIKHVKGLFRKVRLD